MPKVFVVQETTHNIEPARKFGELQVMLMFGDVKDGNDHMVKVLRTELRDVGSKDYILCIGDPVAIGLAIHIALTNSDGQINVLTWDKKRYVYDKSVISI